MTLKEIHNYSGWHEESVKNSNRCGCFSCLTMFPSSEVLDWITEPENCPRGPGKTAICPKCGVDTVLPESEHYHLDIDLLKKMNQKWC